MTEMGMKIFANTGTHDDVIKVKHFPRCGPFVSETTDDWWIPLTKASDAELWCFFNLRLSKQLCKQPIWDANAHETLCHPKMT